MVSLNINHSVVKVNKFSRNIFNLYIFHSISYSFFTGETIDFFMLLFLVFIPNLSCEKQYRKKRLQNTLKPPEITIYIKCIRKTLILSKNQPQ